MRYDENAGFIDPTVLDYIIRQHRPREMDSPLQQNDLGSAGGDPNVPQENMDFQVEPRLTQEGGIPHFDVGQYYRKPKLDVLPGLDTKMFMGKQEANGRVLTARQIILLEKIEAEHNASTAAEEITWTEDFINNKGAEIGRASCRERV